MPKIADQVSRIVLTRARLAITAVQPLGFFPEVDVSDEESVAQVVWRSEFDGYEDDYLSEINDAEFDKLLFSDVDGVVPFVGDAAAEAGDLTHVLNTCAALAGPEAFPVADIEEHKTERGFVARWTSHGDRYELEVSGDYWGPAEAINAAVRGPRRFYEGPHDISWCMFWLTEDERTFLRTTRGWDLYG